MLSPAILECENDRRLREARGETELSDGDRYPESPLLTPGAILLAGTLGFSAPVLGLLIYMLIFPI